MNVQKVRFGLRGLLVVLVIAALVMIVFGNRYNHQLHLLAQTEQLLQESEVREFEAHLQHHGDRSMQATPGMALRLDTERLEVKLVEIQGNTLVFDYRNAARKPDQWVRHAVTLEPKPMTKRAFGYVWFDSELGYPHGVFILTVSKTSIVYSPIVQIHSGP